MFELVFQRKELSKIGKSIVSFFIGLSCQLQAKELDLESSTCGVDLLSKEYFKQSKIATALRQQEIVLVQE